MRLSRIARILLALAAVFRAWPVSAQPAAANGSMEGRVVNLSTGAPIAKATVTLYFAQANTLNAVRPTFPPVETDEQGRFAFRNLKAAIYALSAQREGFLRPGYQSAGSHRSVLGEAQALSGAVLSLTPEAVVTVKVMDRDGRPLPSAGIRLLRKDDLGGERPVLAASTGRADAAGESRMANLAPGDYVLEGSPPPKPRATPGQAMLRKPELSDLVTYYPGVADPAAAATIHVNPGEVRAIDIKLLRAAVVSIRGKVIDPLVNTETTFVRLAARNAAGASPPVDTHVSPDGSFLMKGAPPGSYYLTASRVSFRQSLNPAAKGATTIRVEPGSMKTEAIAVRAIEVGDKDLDGINLAMAPPIDVYGTVAVERNANSQCRLFGPIDGGPSVFLTPETSGVSPGGTAELGLGYGFTVKNLPPMRYRAAIWNAGDCYVKSVQYGGREAKNGVVDLAPDTPLEFTLNLGLRLEGTVVDGDGRPPARALVTLVTKNGPPVSMGSVWVRADGSFFLRGIRPDSYRLFAWEDNVGDRPSPELLRAFEGRATPLTLTAAGNPAPVRIVAIPAAESAKISGLYSAPPPAPVKGGIAGRVLDAVTGAPLQGAALSLKGWSDATPQSSAETDGQGRFEFRDLLPGFYNLSAQHPGFTAATYRQGESPFGAIIVGEGQQVLGIALQLAPQP